MKLTEEQKKNLAHALHHLLNNKIHIPEKEYLGGWYCGNKANFIKRHVKAITMLQEMLKED